MAENTVTMTPQKGVYYTVAQTQEILGYKNRSGIDYIIKRGYFPNMKVVGGTPGYKIYEILGDDIIEFLNSRNHVS